MHDGPEMGGLEILLERLPAEMVDSFTPQQRAALWNAFKPVSWRHHPIHIHLSFPVVGGSFFLTVVGGRDDRSPERRRRERRLSPVRSDLLCGGGAGRDLVFQSDRILSGERRFP